LPYTTLFRSKSAEKRSEERRAEADGGEGEAPVEGAVAHPAEEGADEGLRELVGELVEDDEGENLERTVAGEKSEERLPHRAPERCRGGQRPLRLRRAPGHSHGGQIREGEAGVDDRPRPG